MIKNLLIEICPLDVEYFSESQLDCLINSESDLTVRSEKSIHKGLAFDVQPISDNIIAVVGIITAIINLISTLKDKSEKEIVIVINREINKKKKLTDDEIVKIVRVIKK